MTHEPGDACCTPSTTSWAPSRADSDHAEPSRQASPSGRTGGIAPAPAPSANGMVELPGGAFLMGGETGDGPDHDGEGPVREVTLRPFAIDAQAVTNAQFAAFIEATGYETEAERFGWSFVFKRHLSRQMARRLEKTNAVVQAPWWIAVPGARWNLPEGPGRDLRGRERHPAVHVSWNDALAYCEWAGTRLPTEAEWEYAARGGLEQAIYPWGDELTPGGEHRCNIWQGAFPDRDTGADGFTGTAPVDSFEPNGYGLSNTSGNVWEWTADWYSIDHHRAEEAATRVDPAGPPLGSHRVQRGGSFLCHASYCNRYRVAARTGNTPDSSTANSGFRCARDL